MPDSDFFDQVYVLIMTQDPSKKCKGVTDLHNNFSALSEFSHDSITKDIAVPGLPQNLQLVAPRLLKRRGIQSQTGRNILMHSIAHIEFNAINLALDAAYRFRHQPKNYYQEWLAIASDEARHFMLLRNYLQNNDCEYANYPAHNGLWDMAVRTSHDVVARMALVPRVLEARGLDVTPTIIKRLNSVNDTAATTILETIYNDEIGHVLTGSKWYNYLCQQQGLEPRATFRKMIDVHLYGGIKGPLNIAARLQAGFDEQELNSLLD